MTKEINNEKCYEEVTIEECVIAYRLYGISHECNDGKIKTIIW